MSKQRCAFGCDLTDTGILIRNQLTDLCGRAFKIIMLVVKQQPGRIDAFFQLEFGNSRHVNF